MNVYISPVEATVGVEGGDELIAVGKVVPEVVVVMSVSICHVQASNTHKYVQSSLTATLYSCSSAVSKLNTT